MLMLIKSGLVPTPTFCPISIHLMLMLIPVKSSSMYTIFFDFNTSHVNVNQHEAKQIRQTKAISIHLMLMLILQSSV